MTPTQATQVRDDPSSTLEGLEEDDEITADRQTEKHNCDSLSQSVSYRYGLGENWVGRWTTKCCDFQNSL